MPKHTGSIPQSRKEKRRFLFCFKTTTDEQLLYACIAPNLSDRDFFIRKAIGWALREYAKTRPAAVRRYVREHADALSPLSRREATKHLADDDAPG